MAKFKIIIDTNVYGNIKSAFDTIIRNHHNLNTYSEVWTFLKQPSNFNNIPNIVKDYGNIVPILKLIVSEQVEIHVPKFVYSEFIKGYTSKVAKSIKLEDAHAKEQREKLLDSIPGDININKTLDELFPSKLTTQQQGSMRSLELQKEIENRIKIFLDDMVINKKESGAIFNLLDYIQMHGKLSDFPPTSKKNIKDLQYIASKYQHKTLHLDKKISDLSKKLGIPPISNDRLEFTRMISSIYNKLREYRFEDIVARQVFEAIALRLAKNKEEFDVFDLKLYLTAKEMKAHIVTLNDAAFHEINDPIFRGYFNDVYILNSNINYKNIQDIKKIESESLPPTELLIKKLKGSFTKELDKTINNLDQIASENQFLPKVREKLTLLSNEIKEWYLSDNTEIGKNVQKEVLQHSILLKKMGIFILEKDNGILKVNGEKLLLDAKISKQWIEGDNYRIDYVQEISQNFFGGALEEHNIIFKGQHNIDESIHELTGSVRNNNPEQFNGAYVEIAEAMERNVASVGETSGTNTLPKLEVENNISPCHTLLPTTCTDQYNFDFMVSNDNKQKLLAESLGIPKKYLENIPQRQFNSYPKNFQSNYGSKWGKSGHNVNSILQTINIFLILKSDLDKQDTAVELAKDGAIISAPILSRPVAWGTGKLYSEYVVPFLAKKLEAIRLIEVQREVPLLSKFMANILDKLLTSNSKNFFETLSKIVGPGLMAILSSIDLAKSIKELQNVKDYYEAASLKVSITTNAGIIVLSGAELAAIMAGIELGPEVAIGTFTIIIVAHLAQAGIALNKLKSKIDLSIQEQLEEYGRILIGQGYSQHTLNNLEAKEFYKQLMIDFVKSADQLDFDAIVTTLPDIIRYSNAVLNGKHETHKMDNRFIPDKCKIACSTAYNTTKIDSITSEQASVDIKSSLKDSSSYTQGISRILLREGDMNYIPGTTLVCATKTQDVSAIELNRQNVSSLPHNHGRFTTNGLDHHPYCNADTPSCTKDTIIYRLKELLSLNPIINNDLSEIVSSHNKIKIYNRCEHAVALINNTRLDNTRRNNTDLKVLYDVQGKSVIKAGDDDNLFIVHANSTIIGGNNSNILLLASHFNQRKFTANDTAQNILLLSQYDFTEENALNAPHIHTIVGTTNVSQTIYAGEHTKYINSKGESRIYTKHANERDILIDSEKGDKIFLNENSSITHTIKIVESCNNKSNITSSDASEYQSNEPVRIITPNIERKNGTIIVYFDYDVRQLSSLTYDNLYGWLEFTLLEPDLQQLKTVFLYSYKQIVSVCLLMFKNNVTLTPNIPIYKDYRKYDIKDVTIYQNLSSDPSVIEQEQIINNANNLTPANFTCDIRIESNSFYAVINEKVKNFDHVFTIPNKTTNFFSLRDQSDTYYIAHFQDVIINNYDGTGNAENDLIDFRPLLKICDGSRIDIKNTKYQHNDLVIEYGLLNVNCTLDFPLIGKVTLKRYKEGHKFQHIKFMINNSNEFYLSDNNGVPSLMLDNSFCVRDIFLSAPITHISSQELEGYCKRFFLLQANTWEDIYLSKRNDDLILLLKSVGKALVIIDYYRQLNNYNLELQLVNQTIDALELHSLAGLADSISDDTISKCIAPLIDKILFYQPPADQNYSVYLNGIDRLGIIHLKNTSVQSVSILPQEDADDTVQLLVNETIGLRTISIHDWQSNNDFRPLFIFRDASLSISNYSANQTTEMENTLSQLQHELQHIHDEWWGLLLKIFRFIDKQQENQDHHHCHHHRDKRGFGDYKEEVDNIDLASQRSVMDYDLSYPQQKQVATSGASNTKESSPINNMINWVKDKWDYVFNPLKEYYIDTSQIPKHFLNQEQDSRSIMPLSFFNNLVENNKDKVSTHNNSIDYDNHENISLKNITSTIDVNSQAIFVQWVISYLPRVIPLPKWFSNWLPKAPNITSNSNHSDISLQKQLANKVNESMKLYTASQEMFANSRYFEDIEKNEPQWSKDLLEDNNAIFPTLLGNMTEV